MTSKNDPPNQESTPPDLFSSMETRAMLEEFRELVRAGILRVTPENEVLPVKDPPAATAAPGTPPAPSREEDVALLDKQLVEWLERRRTRRGEAPKPAAAPDPAGLRQQVVEALAEKILEIWDRADHSAEPHSSLRGQVAARLVEEILKRWQRGLE